MKTLRVLLVALAAVGCIAIGLSRADNYNATAGSGLSFLAKLIGGNLLPLIGVCDYQNGSPNCASVTTWGSAPITSASALNVNANVINASQDPCLGVKNASAISTTATNLQLVSGSTGANVTLCSISVIAGAATVFNVIEGTGGSCTGGTEAAVFGSITAASGMSFAANGGFTLGSGTSTIGKTHTTGNGMCILQSGTNLLGGNFTFIQQ